MLGGDSGNPTVAVSRSGALSMPPPGDTPQGSSVPSRCPLSSPAARVRDGAPASYGETVDYALKTSVTGCNVSAMDRSFEPYGANISAGQREVERLGSEELVDTVSATSPHLADLLVEFGLGRVMARADLDSRTRELIAIAILVSLQADEDFVAVHVRAAIRAGASPSEIIESISQVAIFAGFPAALRSLDKIKDAILREGGEVPVPRSGRAVVESFFDNLTSGNLKESMALVGENAIWKIPGDSDLVPWVGEHHGREDVEKFYETLFLETETEELNIGPIVGHGSLVFVRGEFSYRFPRNGGACSGCFVIVFTVEDGLIEQYEMHENSLDLARCFNEGSR